MTALTDLIAELAEVARLIRKDNAGAGQWGMPSAAVNYLRTHHAELTRILTDDAAIRAAHHDLVIRLGEVTTELEAAKNDVSRWQGIAELSHGEMAERMETARMDAERYCYLRDGEPDAAWTHAYYELGGVAQPEHVDAAIDAAMKESGK